MNIGKYVLFSFFWVCLSLAVSCGSNSADKAPEQKTSVATKTEARHSPESKSPQPAVPDANFRRAKWGMTKDQILKQEEKPPVHQESNFLGFQGRVQGMDCMIAYIFAKDHLVRAKYLVQEKHSNQNDYITDYENLKKALIEKYGNPSENRTIWKNELYKDDVQHYGTAVAAGHLMYFSQWETEPTIITLMLNGDNFDITLGIEYTSKELEGLEKEAQKERSEGEL